MLLPGRVALGVLAQLGEGRSHRANLFADVTEGGANYIARHQHQTNLMMIAKQRGQALVVEQRNHTQHGNTGNNGKQLTKQFAVPDSIVYRRIIQQQ
ncbi:hypothetical protein D3C77_411950 [compost metagenome]